LCWSTFKCIVCMFDLLILKCSSIKSTMAGCFLSLRSLVNSHFLKRFLLLPLYLSSLTPSHHSLSQQLVLCDLYNLSIAKIVVLINTLNFSLFFCLLLWLPLEFRDMTSSLHSHYLNCWMNQVLVLIWRNWHGETTITTLQY
jgi:hypothetical protein